MNKKEIKKTISNRDETEVRVTFMEGNQMRLYAIQDGATVPYIDCIIPTDRKLVEELSNLDTVDEVLCYSEI